MEHMKNHRLLRPFDAAAAARGERICNFCGDELWDFVAGPDSVGNLVVKIKDDGRYVDPKKCPVSGFRMAPLCWVEGKPVYKGDTLYNPHVRHPFNKKIVEDVRANSICSCAVYGADGMWSDIADMSWKPVKHKKKEWCITSKANLFSKEEAEARLKNFPGCVIAHAVLEE
jgi:hypothetical protein